MRIKIPVIEFIPALLLGLIDVLTATGLSYVVPHGALAALDIVAALIGGYVGYCLGRLAHHGGKPAIIQRRHR